MKTKVVSVAFIVAAAALSGFAQQKGQYVLGTNGLNAGIQPAAGFTYSNEATFYSAGSLKGADGQAIPVIGTYDLWLDQNLFIYTSNLKVFGGTYGAMLDLIVANGSVTSPRIGFTAGAAGFSDMYVQPLTLGYHFTRIDFSVGFGFIAPTGRYSPTSPDNTGSGYWGYMPSFGSTIYLTKNKGTTLSVFSTYEFHGRKRDTNVTPGQTADFEWGLGQLLPLKKNLLQVGVVGYGQWQTGANGGSTPDVLKNARYAVAALGPQATFIVPKWNLNLFLRYEPEFGAVARVEGATLAFGGAISFPVAK